MTPEEGNAREAGSGGLEAGRGEREAKEGKDGVTKNKGKGRGCRVPAKESVAGSCRWWHRTHLEQRRCTLLQSARRGARRRKIVTPPEQAADVVVAISLRPHIH